MLRGYRLRVRPALSTGQSSLTGVGGILDGYRNVSGSWYAVGSQ